MQLLPVDVGQWVNFEEIKQINHFTSKSRPKGDQNYYEIKVKPATGYHGNTARTVADTFTIRETSEFYSVVRDFVERYTYKPRPTSSDEKENLTKP